jgi:hypothetical protein
MKKTIASILLITAMLALPLSFVLATSDEDRNEQNQNENANENRNNRNDFRRPQFCFCHDAYTNPQTVCSSNQREIWRHASHLFDRQDTFGRCRPPRVTPTPTPIVTGPTPTPTPGDPPPVPEFGLITGLMALGASAGSFYFLKKKN